MFDDPYELRPQARPDELELGPEATSLDLLQAVYRNPQLSLHVRMRAASLAIPFEHPKLSAAQLVHYDGTWAERLDKAVARSEAARVVNGAGSKPRVIEHQPQPKPSLRRI
jgi:hypothetical protein